MRISVICLFTCAVLLMAVPASADYEAGVAAYKRGDYETAFREWMPLAEEGHTKAENGIGVLYGKGQGRPQDFEEALKWYSRSAEGGYDSAMHNMGLLYQNGQGVEQDYAEAAKWFRMSAEKGHAQAQGRLAGLYARGLGVEQDFAEAYKWLLIAQRNGENVTFDLEQIGPQLTPEERARAEKEAAAWEVEE